MWQILQIKRNSQNAMNLIFILLFTFFSFPKVHRTNILRNLQILFEIT